MRIGEPRRPSVKGIMAVAAVGIIAVVFIGHIFGMARGAPKDEPLLTQSATEPANPSASPSDDPPDENYATPADMMDSGPKGICAFDKEFSGTKNQCGGIGTLLGNKIVGQISAPQLSIEYIQNQVSADNLYNLKNIEISGPIESVTEDAYDVTVKYYTADEMPITAKLWTDQIGDVDGKRNIVPVRDAAAHLARGQYVTMSCFNRGVVDYGISLVNCLLFPPQKYVPSPEIAQIAAAVSSSSSTSAAASSSAASAASESMVAFQEEQRRNAMVGKMGEDQIMRQISCDQSRGADYRDCALAQSEGQKLVNMGECYQDNIWRDCRRPEEAGAPSQ